MHQPTTWRIHALFAVLLLLCTSLIQAQNTATDLEALELRVQQSQDSIRAMVEVQPKQLSRLLDEIESIKAAEERKFKLFNQMEWGKATLIGLILLGGGVLLIFGIVRISENRLVDRLTDRQQFLKTNLSRHIPEYLIGDLVHEETISPMVWKNCAVLQVDILENKPFDTPSERISAMDNLFKACEGLSQNHGIIQVKNTGQKIVAVCKSSNLTPMEQANISAGCLNQLRSTMETQADSGLALKAGITYGDVVAGLTKSGDKTSFDIWGNPVQEVQEITRSSRPGTISTTKYIARSLNKSEFSINEAEEGRYEL
jgi:class 3 adenylate cyclase